MARITRGVRRAILTPTLTKGVGVPPPFAYEAETEALVATFSATPSARRQKTINRFIRRLKSYPTGDPVWPRLLFVQKAMADNNGALANWVNPAAPAAWRGTALTHSDVEMTPAAGRTVNTNFNASSLPVDDYSIWLYVTGGTAGTNSDMGCRDGSNIGVGLQAKRSDTGKPATRASSGANLTFAATTDWNNLGIHGIQRSGSASYGVYKGPVLKDTVNADSQALPALPIYWMGSNVNGGSTDGTTSQSMIVIARSLSSTQIVELNGAMERLHVEMAYGEIDEYLPGYQPQRATYDVVVYGATSGGVIAAQAAKRRGKSVCIVGQRNVRRLGGMSAGGLGYVDLDNITALSGYAKYVVERIKTIAGTSTTYFEPRHFERVMREMVDPSKTGGVDVPVYWTDGIAWVAKAGAQITKIRTIDGREFSASQFVDASYMSDLMVRSGVSYVTYREAAGSGVEALNGYRSVQSGDGGSTHQFTNHAGSLVAVDPWLTPGSPASGLVAGVQGVYTAGSPALGAQDAGVQAFNFRLITTTDPALRIPMRNTPPAGYSKSNYELLLRLFAVDPTLTLGDVIKADQVAATTNGGIWDINSKGGFSTDLFTDSATRYVAASQAGRDAIRQEFANHILGLWYLLQYEADARIPAAVRTSALNHGWPNNYAADWLPGDEPWMSPQLYEREGPRMVSDIVWTGNDIAATDGTTPRSTKTIAVGSYAMDSHHIRRMAYEYTPGSWKVWNEGNFFAAAGGVDQMAPLPYDIIVPKAGEATNLLCLFGCSATHVAFGTIRMELTHMEMAQAAGEAAVLAINGSTAVQAVDYSTLRGKLQEAPVLTGQTAMYLPQVN